MRSDLDFSIVVPTRNRADTLLHCLWTIKEQICDDVTCEIIVSDNSDEAESVKVKSVCDLVFSHLGRGFSGRCVRPSSVMSMTKHWEFAISHASGEYVILLGDDDGLLRHCLASLSKLKRIRDFDVMAWMPAFYYWPQLDKDAANRSAIPISYRIRRLRSADSVSAVYSSPRDYFILPMTYNASIKNELISSVREKHGCLYGSESPDIFSGFLIAASVESYLFSEIPMSVMGTSASSNGRAFFSGGKKAVADDFEHLNRSANIVRDSRLPKLPLISAAVYDSYIHVAEIVGPKRIKNEINRKFLWNSIAHEIKEKPSLELISIKPDLIAYFGNEIEMELDAIIRSKAKSGQDGDRDRSKGLYDGGGRLLIDCERHGVNNVNQFAQFFEDILYYGESGINFEKALDKGGLSVRFRRAARAWLRG